MKALSLWQPWASAIATGAKRYETRGWPAPLPIIGTRIAIHAAKKPLAGIFQDLYDDELCCQLLRSAGFSEEWFGDNWRPNAGAEAIPMGCIVATGVVASCERTEIVELRADEMNRVSVEHGACESDLGNYGPRRFAWRFEHVRKLPEPIPFRGMQGIFDVPDDLATLSVQPVALGGLFEGVAA